LEKNKETINFRKGKKKINKIKGNWSCKEIRNVNKIDTRYFEIIRRLTKIKRKKLMQEREKVRRAKFEAEND